MYIFYNDILNFLLCSKLDITCALYSPIVNNISTTFLHKNHQNCSTCHKIEYIFAVRNLEYIFEPPKL